MLKKYFLIIPLLLVLASIKAQITFRNGFREPFAGQAPLLLADSSSLELGVTEASTGVKSWNQRRSRLSLRRRDAQGSILREAFPDPGTGVSAFFTALRKVGNRYWLIYLEPGTGNNYGNVMAVPVDTVTLATGEPKMIAEAAAMALGVSGADGRAWFASEASPDGSKLFFFSGTDRDAELFFSVLDDKLDVLWYRREKVAGLVQSVAVANDGTFYIGYKEKDAGKLAWASKNDPVKSLPVSLGAEGPQEVLLLAERMGGIRIGGTYHVADGDRSVGAWIGTVNPQTHAAESIQKYPFSALFVEQLATDYLASTKARKYGLRNSYTLHMAQGPDGVIGMYAEFFVIDAAVRHESIFLIRFTGTGIVDARIPRVTISVPWAGDQFAVNAEGDKYHFYYFDNPDNLTRDINKDPLYPKSKTVFVRATIDGSGKVARTRVNYVYE